MAAVHTGPYVKKVTACRRGQAERLVEFTKGKQPGMGRDARAMESQLVAAVEGDSNTGASRFPRWCAAITRISASGYVTSHVCARSEAVPNWPLRSIMLPVWAVHRAMARGSGRGSCGRLSRDQGCWSNKLRR